MPRALALIACTAVLISCGNTEVRVADPLEERIFRSRNFDEISRDQLLATLSSADVIYLGEQHDNPRQHALQLDIVNALVARGDRPAIGFEVFSVIETSELMSYATAKARKSHRNLMSPEERLRKTLGWGKSRDQSWNFYGPLVKLAREQQLEIFGIDLPLALRRRITRVGVAGLTRVERRLLYPTASRSDTYAAFMAARLTAMHCGHANGAYMQRLYETWIARNDAMAAAINDSVAERDGGPVVVILGGGHTHFNLGAFGRVAQLTPGIEQVNLGFREVPETPVPVEELLRPLKFEGTLFAPDHEYIWFTPRAGTPKTDPCEYFGRKPEKTS